MRGRTWRLGAAFVAAVLAVPLCGVDYLTFHGDNARTGWNSRERQLTVASVSSRRFGRLFAVPVDGQVYGQPLYMHGVPIRGKGKRDVLVVATERDSVYAFDARTGAGLWRHDVAGIGAEAADAEAVGPCHVAPKVGVSSTPVIDPTTRTIYVVSKAQRGDGNTRTYHHALHALALESGQDRVPPVEVTGTATLTDRGVFTFGPHWRHNVRRLFGNTLTFDPRVQYSRTGILLRDGVLYFGYGSHCHDDQSHGWVFAYRASDLKQVARFVTTRDWQAVNGGGVWQGGFGISADDHSLYLTTGNGPFNADTGGANYGDSALKMTPDLRVVDSFTPFTQAELAENGADFGGSGIVVLPDQPGRYRHLAVAASKVRALFLLDRDRLGGYAPGGPDRVLQVIGDDHDGSSWCIGTCGGPAYYAGPTGQLIFDVWAQDALRAYRLEARGGRPRLTLADRSRNTFPGSGGSIPVVSSNGSTPGTGIVWVTTRPDSNRVAVEPIVLYAYDASNLAHVLFSAKVGLWPNPLGHPELTPTVADGRVFVGGYDQVTVFGLRDSP